MTADDLRKIAQEHQPVVADNRLEKYVEWIERDCRAAAVAGKFFLKVDYSTKPMRDEFILQIQDRFISDGCTVSTNPDNFRQFMIDWTPVEEVVVPKPQDNVANG